MQKQVLIIASLFGNNRQGYDLADILRKAGHTIRLVQFASTSNPEKGEFGVGYVNPHGRLSKFHVLQNLLHLFAKTLYCKKDIVVCIGSLNLWIAAFYKIVCRSRVVYYSLEYSEYGVSTRFLIRHIVDKYIDVEEHRRERVYQNLSINLPFCVMHNLPMRTEAFPKGGSLRCFLSETYGASGNEKLVIYAGSYQRYAHIETIVEASKSFPPNTWLILMVAWGLPDKLKTESENCKIIPPHSGMEFFDWLADADCALLPYESDDDFNVQYCSPQKLFDCYLAGVPYLASPRPIIKDTLSVFDDAGRVCDFKSVDAIVKGVNSVLAIRKDVCREKMRDLYVSEFNYNRHSENLVKFICT